MVAASFSRFLRITTAIAWCSLATAVSAQTDAAKVLPPVEVATVRTAQVNSGYRVVGSVVPLRTSTIGSAVGGRVDDLFVTIGEPVKASQPLAQLRTDTLEIELAAANAELDFVRQELAEVENGSRVEDVAEAEAMLAGTRVAMEAAARQLRRLQMLVSARAASDEDLEGARERADLAKFAFSAAEALLERVKQGPRGEQIAQKQAQVELQTQRVRLIEDRILKHTIRAPFDGFVSMEYTEMGAWINSGDPVAQVIQLDLVEVQAPVTANYISKLRLGDSIRVEFPDLPDKLLTGTIERIVPVADSRARTFPVLIRLKNEVEQGQPLLMSGMLARVDFPAGKLATLPLVPKDALVLNEAERAVFVVDRSSKQAVESGVGVVRKVFVELGVAQDGMIQVKGDLSDGQLVVVVGNERLVAGSQVAYTLVAETARE